MTTETEHPVESDGSAPAAPASLPDHTITSPETFGWVTADPRQIAGLYAFCKLDVLIDLARAVSLDFFDRPLVYTTVSRDVTRKIAALNARYGSDEEHLSREQRSRIYAGVFGADDSSDFADARDALLAACAAFAERVFDTGELMLRARVWNAHWAFKSHLDTMYGSSLDWSSTRALPALAHDTAYPILRDRGVAGVFGLSEAAAPHWPLIQSADGNKVVEEISRRLHEPPDEPITRERFSALQRAALRGTEAIATVIDYTGRKEDVEQLDLLITKCYTWHAALVELHGTAPVASVNGNRSLERVGTPPAGQPLSEPAHQPNYVR